MFKIEEVLEATGGTLVREGARDSFTGVLTDSRKLAPGCLFVAIKGANFDGHDFVEEAVKQGASGVVVEHRVSISGSASVVQVDDTLKALGKLAGYHRRRFDVPVIALTGSNGKTTTKEMLFTILSYRYNVLRNEGTENNFIGVPQTLLKMERTHDIAVIELGTNHFGEIAYLSDMVQPNCGIIVNAGPSHLEFFGTVENVRTEKLDLLKRVGQGGYAVVNGDDCGLSDAAMNMCADTVTFGLNAGCSYTAGRIKEDGCGMDFTVNDAHIVKLGIIGRHNIYNALAAIAAASLYGVEVPEAAKALESFRLPKLRMELASSDGVDFVFDCYNSNPLSMKAAIETLRDLGPDKRKVLVAGDMLELGDCAPESHREIGRLAARANVEVLVSVGSFSGYILEGAREEGIGGETLLRFDSPVEAAKALKKILRRGDLVLVKGSRGMKMEEIKKCFINCSTR